jgi:hypothetical protein
MMLRASMRVWRPGRLRSLLVCSFVLGGSLLAASLTVRTQAAPPKDGGKDAPAKVAKGKEDAAKEVPMKWPEPIKLTLVAPGKSADSQELAQLRDMVGTINKLTEAKWKENKIVPSRYADDYEFIRRASLDIIGRIAKPEEIREFRKDLNDTSRRSKLINRLLDSDEFPRHWANLWANWLLGRSGAFGRGKYHDAMATWLEDQFSQNKPYGSIVKSLITATGDNDDTQNGGAATNFILAHLGESVPRGKEADDGHFQMVPITSRITRLFLGTQVQCAQCHDHPFYSNIKQEHFWGVNAFLRQVNRRGNLPPMGQMMALPKLTLVDDENVVRVPSSFFEKRNGAQILAKAEFLPAGEDQPRARLPVSTQGLQRREKLAEYILDHPQFPKAIVNRMWGVFFGRGFVNPVDDFNDQNQPSNPELLDEMASRFKHYNYDLKKLIRWICNSNPYNLSYVANKTNDKPEHEALFGRMIMKSLSPEQLFESLMVATKAEAAESKQAKANLKRVWLGNLISNFGDDEGNEVNFNGTVVQALLMMNGKDINEAISRRQKGAVAIAINNQTEQAAIRALYLTALNRPPTPKEVGKILHQFRLLNATVDFNDHHNYPERRYEDLFWALLNSNEFLLNH